MQNILITGGNGQLGRSFAKIAKDYSDFHFIFTDLPDIDITDRKAIELIIEAENVDIIINCAAYTNVEAAETNSEEAFLINDEGPRVLAAAAREFGIKLVHISTDYVFGGYEHHIPYKEDDEPSPINVYGKSKLAGEVAVEESGCDAAIIRTSWLYSEFGKNFVKTMLHLAQERDKIDVVNDQFGSPTYATDLASAVMTIIARGIEGGELYHYCDSGTTSWYGLAQAIFELSGSTVSLNGIPSNQYPTTAKRAGYTVLDNSKILSIGATAPQWKDSLEKCLAEIGKKTGDR